MMRQLWLLPMLLPIRSSGEPVLSTCGGSFLFVTFFAISAFANSTLETMPRTTFSPTQCSHDVLWSQTPEPEIESLKYQWRKEKLIALKKRSETGIEDPALFGSFAEWLGCDGAQDGDPWRHRGRRPYDGEYGSPKADGGGGIDHVNTTWIAVGGVVLTALMAVIYLQSSEFSFKNITICGIRTADQVAVRRSSDASSRRSDRKPNRSRERQKSPHQPYDRYGRSDDFNAGALEGPTPALWPVWEE